jgi:hypothetical protein
VQLRQFVGDVFRPKMGAAREHPIVAMPAIAASGTLSLSSNARRIVQQKSMTPSRSDHCRENSDRNHNRRDPSRDPQERQ